MKAFLLGVYELSSWAFGEIIVRLTGAAAIGVMAGTFMWPFMPVGWWGSVLKYPYMMVAIGLLWLVACIIKGILIAAWKDRDEVCKIIKARYRFWRDHRNEK